MVGHALCFTNATTTFMGMMDDILRPFTNTFVVVYLDDILIYSKTWAEHLQHIQQVLHTLRQHKLYANLEKCSFGMDRVHYLGYIIDQHGVHVDQALSSRQSRAAPAPRQVANPGPNSAEISSSNGGPQRNGDHLLPKEGGLIQMDIGGHPPFPTGSKQFSGNFGNLLFLIVFNFWGHFEGLNEGFPRSSQLNDRLWRD